MQQHSFPPRLPRLQVLGNSGFRFFPYRHLGRRSYGEPPLPPNAVERGAGDGCGCVHNAGATPSSSSPQRDGTSTIIDRVMRLRREKQAGQGALPWAALNLYLAALVCTELSGNLLSRAYDIAPRWPVWYGELALAAVFGLNALANLWKYFRSITVTGPSTIAMTPGQYALLGLRDSGIQATPPPPQRPAAVRALFQSSAAMLGGQNVLGFSPSGPPTTTTTTTITTSSLGVSRQARYHRTTSRSVLRHPRGNDEDYIEDRKTLQRFLHAEKEKEHQRQRSRLGGPPEWTSSSHRPPPPPPPFWNHNAQSLAKFQYQPACRYSPAASSARRGDDDAADPGSKRRQTAEEVWAQVAAAATGTAGRPPVSADRIVAWTANLRMWISDTVLAPLVEEIHSVNRQLRRTGTPEEVRIGETAVSVLRQVAAANASSIPTMRAVVQYLDVSYPDQEEYLLDRMEELARGGCMSSFRWNGGGGPRTPGGGRRWRADVPTDSAILMHAFCTYMDSRLPALPWRLAGKTFTSQHFARTPAGKAPGRGAAAAAAAAAAAPKTLCIHQGGADPPHYQLVHRGRVYALPEDRNNLFHTLLLFLYVVKSTMAGMLGRVSLGPSGVNVLWVFTD